jgi:hypothetical protein
MLMYHILSSTEVIAMVAAILLLRQVFDGTAAIIGGILPGRG